MKAESVITLLTILVLVGFGLLGIQWSRELYSQGREVSERECSVRIERMVRDVDSLTVLVRTYEAELVE